LQFLKIFYTSDCALDSMIRRREKRTKFNKTYKIKILDDN